MKAKIYTAAISAVDITGNNGNEIFTASFASDTDRQRWLDDTYTEINREMNGNEDEDYVVYETLREQEFDIPVFVLINADYRNTDENCGLMTSAYPTKEQAVEHLKESVREEIEANTISETDIDWHTHDGKHGIANMPQSPEIADTERFGWTIEEY